jgi:hypothetical protein
MGRSWRDYNRRLGSHAGSPVYSGITEARQFRAARRKLPPHGPLPADGSGGHILKSLLKLLVVNVGSPTKSHTILRAVVDEAMSKCLYHGVIRSLDE